MLQVDQFGTGPSITMIHGWGAQNAVWADWAKAHLAPHFCVTLIELPGFGSSSKLPNYENDEQLATAWSETILSHLPAKTTLLGWSLGGLLAQNIALHYPQRVEKLILLASTPRFTQTDQWSGAVSPKLMFDFMQSIQADSLAALKSFWALQLQGSELPRLKMREFIKQMQHYQMPTLTGLTQGLTLLKHFDFRKQADQPPQQTLWLIGEKDPLVSTQTIEAFTQNSPNSEFKIIQGAAHTPFVSHPEQTAQAIIKFLNSNTQ